VQTVALILVFKAWLQPLAAAAALANLLVFHLVQAEQTVVQVAVAHATTKLAARGNQGKATTVELQVVLVKIRVLVLAAAAKMQLAVAEQLT
jgi:hypothetical protein